MSDELGIGIVNREAGVGGDPTPWSITSSDLTLTAKAALVFYTSRADASGIVDDTLTDGAVMGVGVACDADGGSTNQTGTQSVRAVDNAATPLPVTRKDGGATTDEVIDAIQRTAGNTRAATHELASWVSQGISLNAVTDTDDVSAAALLFAGVARTYVAAATPSAAGTSEIVGLSSTGGSFRPDLLIFFGQDGGLVNTTTISSALTVLGYCIDDGASSQVHFFADWDAGALNDLTDADAYAGTTTAHADLTTSGTRALQTVTVTITATGFDMISSVGSPDMWYLAIKFTQKPAMYVGHVALPSSPGEFLLATPGVVPRAIVSVNHLLTVFDTLTDGAVAGAAGFSMFTKSAQRAYAIHFQEGVTPTNTGTRHGNHAILTLDHQGTVVHEADLVQMEPGGARLNFTTATAAGTATLLAIGYPSPPSVPRRRARQVRARARLRRRPAGIPMGVPPPVSMAPPRWLRPLLRMRAAMRARLRWKPIVHTVRLVGVDNEDGPKGRVFCPGLKRGRIRSTFEEPDP